MLLPFNSEYLTQMFKDAREKSGMTQLELSRELGYRSPQLVSNWERGLCSPPLDAVSKMIDLFGMSKDKIVHLVLKESRSYLEAQLKGRNKKAKTARS